MNNKSIPLLSQTEEDGDDTRENISGVAEGLLEGLEAGALWICLICGNVGCGRSVQRVKSHNQINDDTLQGLKFLGRDSCVMKSFFLIYSCD